MLLKQGDKGQLVKTMQRASGLPEAKCDGDFGPGTRAQLIAYQGAQGLTADGACGADTMRRMGIEPGVGVDVSHYQASEKGNSLINWPNAKTGGVKFSYIKANQGTGGADPAMQSHAAMASSAGVKIGPYHFANVGSSAKDSAAAFLKAIKGIVWDLPPALDLELDGGLSPVALQAWALEWLQLVGAALKRKPILYTGQAFIRDKLAGGGPLTAYALWVARYTGASDPGSIGDWPAWLIWQHSTAAGVIAGAPGPIDQNRLFGGQAALDALCAS